MGAQRTPLTPLTDEGWVTLAAGTGLLGLGHLLAFDELGVVGGGAVLLVLLTLVVRVVSGSVSVALSSVPATVREGEALTVGATLRPTSWRPIAAGRVVVHVGDSTDSVAVPPRSRRCPETGVTFSLEARRRGSQAVEVTHGSPILGLVRHRAPQTVGARTVRVLPRWDTTLRSHDVLRLLSGGGADDTVSPMLRDVAAGDDARLIHWPSSVRLDRLVVRPRESDELPLTLVLDPTGYPAADGEASSPDFEAAVRVTASIAVAGHRAGFAVSLVVVGRPGHSCDAPCAPDRLPLVVLVSLADVRPEAEAGSLEEAARRLPHPAAGLVIVARTVRDRDLAAIRRRSRVRDVVAVCVGEGTAPRRRRFAGVLAVAGPTSSQVVATLAGATS